MKALITGIAGFAGQYLAAYLIGGGVSVWGTKLENEDLAKAEAIQVCNLDITQANQVESVIDECRPEFIFHLAAQSSVAVSWDNPVKTIATNLNGTINLLEAVRKINHNTKVLLVSSGEVYGPVRKDETPISEGKMPYPQNPYAVSKLTQELFGLQYYKAYNIPIYICRPFNHTGPGQNTGYVVPDFCKQIVDIEHGQSEPVIRVGNLSAERDISDVRDVIEAYWLIVKRGRPGTIYNIGAGKPVAIQYILDYLLNNANLDIAVKTDKARFRPIDVPIISCDYSKLRRETGWEPAYKIETTLTDTLNYWRNGKGIA